MRHQQHCNHCSGKTFVVLVFSYNLQFMSSLIFHQLKLFSFFIFPVTFCKTTSKEENSHNCNLQPQNDNSKEKKKNSFHLSFALDIKILRKRNIQEKKSNRWYISQHLFYNIFLLFKVQFWNFKNLLCSRRPVLNLKCKCERHVPVKDSNLISSFFPHLS